MDQLQLPAGIDDCPSEAELAAFHLGKLEDSELEAIASHLGRCSSCLGHMDRLSSGQRMPWSPTNTLAGLSQDLNYRRMEERAKQLVLSKNDDAVRGTASAAGLSPPFQLRQYNVLEVVGRGGMGTVYRALHIRLKQEKAIKFLNPYHTSPAGIARFQKEMEVIGRMDHPNVVRATDAGEWNGMHYLVMDFIYGATLSQLARTGSVRVPDACELIRQAAVGLQYISSNNLIHRDVKPSNLLLTDAGTVKILDLGLATFLRDGNQSQELTASNDVLGTVDYMAPEQWRESRRVDIRADIYSLGCSLYRLLVGKPPFDLPDIRSHAEKRLAHLELEVPSIHAARADVPPAVAAIVERMLAKSPDDRYAQPNEVAEALAPYCGGSDLEQLLKQSRHERNRVEAAETDAIKKERTPLRTSGLRGRRTLRWPIVLALAMGASALGLFAVYRQPDRSELKQSAATEREFELHKWHDLLDRPPVELHTTNRSGRSHWDFNAEQRTLTVTAYGKQFLTLGRIQGGGYRLNIAFEQPWPSVTYGIFFGARRLEEGGVKTMRCQEILVGTDGNTKRESFLLERGGATIRYGIHPDGPLHYTGTLSSMPIRRSLQAERQAGHIPVRMDIVVSKQPGLSSVTFNGDQYPDLLLVNKNFTFADYEGEFGICCENCTVTVSTAQFFPTQ